jgi:hypothetical protein
LASLPVDVVPLVRGAVTSFDPDRAFADTLVLACARDPRLCRAAVAKARGAHPDLVEAFTDALALGSGPGLDAAVAELCDDDDPAAIGVGLDVMARRRSVRVGAVVLPLYHLDPGVRMRAADTLGFAAAREAATLTLEKRITIEPSLRVQAAIVTSLVRLGAPHASVYAMRSFEELGKLGQDVDPGTRDCRLVFARACAALGRAPEALKLAEIAATAGELEVLGWFGRVTSVDMLIRVLEGPGREDTLLANAASRALVRITGATREVGQREVELGQGHLTTVPEDELELEPTRWRRYWDERGTSLGTGVKYRFGHRFSADLAAAEHVAQGVRVIDRPMVSLEWSAARAGAGHLADERDWAARQIATASLGGPHA